MDPHGQTRFRLDRGPFPRFFGSVIRAVYTVPRGTAEVTRVLLGCGCIAAADGSAPALHCARHARLARCLAARP